MSTLRERSGRPIQLHGVPLEDRAYDSQGNRLPWALEWADDNPNARHTKRQPEEKGSFGKSSKRKAPRATRTQTPGKRDNPTLDGFEAALHHESEKELHSGSTSIRQLASEEYNGQKVEIAPEPAEVILFGFSSELMWLAIQHYEKLSGGMICEDYDRYPPPEGQRYGTTLGMMSHVPRRPLTKKEKALAMNFRGGKSWIKVTFDSQEAAEHATTQSPCYLNGFWVHAQHFGGQCPPEDEPILMRDWDRQHGLLRASHAYSKFEIPSTLHSPPTRPQNHELGDSGTATIRALVSDPTEALHSTTQDTLSISTATSSSATVADNSLPRLTQRTIVRPSDATSTQETTFTHFPRTQRTILHPAEKAFLPQQTWIDRLMQRLMQNGWMPGDIIGTIVPRTEGGDFDWSSASFYWKTCYWFDVHFGSDLCGFKEG